MRNVFASTVWTSLGMGGDNCVFTRTGSAQATATTALAWVHSPFLALVVPSITAGLCTVKTELSHLLLQSYTPFTQDL